MRGNGLFRASEDGPSAAHSILNHAQANNAHLPTKTNYQSLQANKTSNNGLTAKAGSNHLNEKNEGLRTQLRRSYDASSGSLPHAHGIQPAANVRDPINNKMPNRPHSSSKMNSSNLPRQPQSQTATTIQSLNHEPQPRPSNHEKPKGNRKRDFSKVVDIASRAMGTIDATNSQSTATSQEQPGAGYQHPQRTLDVGNYLSR